MTEPPDAAPPTSLRRHREVLAVAGFVVAMSLVLDVLPDGRVAFRGLLGYPLPHSCATRAWFNFDCPACGLTRSFVHLARGDWSRSYRTHRIGMFMAAAVLLQFPYRLYGLARRESAPLGRIVPKVFGYALIAALIVNWLYNQISPGARVPGG
jgi:hypothetical protein